VTSYRARREIAIPQLPLAATAPRPAARSAARSPSVWRREKKGVVVCVQVRTPYYRISFCRASVFSPTLHPTRASRCPFCSCFLSRDAIIRLQDVSPAGHAGLGPRARQHVVHIVVVIDGQVISKLRLFLYTNVRGFWRGKTGHFGFKSAKRAKSIVRSFGPQQKMLWVSSK
jgi:hypothetical protein